VSAPGRLSSAQLAQVKVFTTAAAWTAHEALPERVDLNVAYAVHGDLRLVATEVLDAVSAAAVAAAAERSGGVKRIKVEGEFELERFAATDGQAAGATAWSARAARLRAEAARAGRGGPVRSPLAGMRTGSSPQPVFQITPRDSDDPRTTP
jgi:hypothetical protein